MLTLYTLLIVYHLFIWSKENRFKYAGNMQGVGLSQSIFAILNWQHPDYSDPFFERSVPFNKRGDYATGFHFLNKAVDLEPKKHLGYRGYIKLRLLRDYEGALSDFERLDSLTPNVVDAPWGEDIDFLRGESYYGLKRFNKALDCFSRSITNQGADWADVQTFVYQGLCYFEMSQFQNAKKAFESSLLQYEDIPEAYFGLGKTYLQIGDTTNAIKFLNKAKEKITFKREDHYKEFLNEIYIEDIEEFMESLAK